MILIFFTGGLVLTGVGLFDAWSGLKSYGWEEKPGVILSSEIRSCGRGKELNSKTYRADIFYRYRLNGYDLTGDVLYPGYESHSSREGARKWLRRFPSGSTVTVYVNPERPRDAMLANGLHFEHMGRPLAGICMAWAALFMFFKLRRKPGSSW